MVKCKKVLPILLLSWAFLGSAVAAQQSLQLPEGLLKGKQIEALFSERTVAANSADGKNQELVIYFKSDGQVQQVEQGFRTNGKWKIRKDDRLCVNLKGSARDCRIIVKKGNEYQQFIVKKDGNHEHELTYVEFRKGNQLTKMSKSPILPKGTLDRKQIKELFTGKTVESITAGKGRVSHSYYGTDGTIEQVRNGKRRLGKWRVTKSGRICLQMEERGEKCRIIVKEGDEYKKFIVRKNGRHQHSVTYRNFVEGKQL